MAPSPNTTDLQTSAAANNATDSVKSRWKVSERILKLIQDDRPAPDSDTWRSRGVRVPSRQRQPVVPLITGDDGQPRDSALDREAVPAWLVSLILHMIMVLLLALVHVSGFGENAKEVILLDWKQPTSPGLTTNAELLPTEPVELSTSSDSNANEEQPAPLVADVVLEVAAVELAVSSPRSVDAEKPLQLNSERLLGFDPNISLEKSISGGRMGDRSSTGRSAAVESGQTTGEAEDAMEMALRWIAAHQHRDGGWSFRLDSEDGPCQGQCENPIVNLDDAPLPRTAATGLALLAFMGAGYTHLEGQYAENVRRGIYYLRSQARETSIGTDLQNGSMYGHGIATLALAEAYVMTGDADLHDLVNGTAMMSAGAQHTSGGWGYMPSSPPDITLTGWQVVALKTAEQRNVKVPTQVFPNAKKYVGTLVDKDGWKYGYKTPEPTLPTTAIGALLQLYLGMAPGQTELRHALDWIAEEGPSPSNVYYDYYAMLALHHSRHIESMRFAKALRTHLLATQAKSGHERGSWHFSDRYGSVGGRLYTTAMCCLILQTPYRYIPLNAPR